MSIAEIISEATGNLDEYQINYQIFGEEEFQEEE